MYKAVAFGAGILIGAVVESGIMLLTKWPGWAAILLSIPFTALLLAAGALIGREAARHGAYRAGYAAGKRHN